jgi:hypothetical protein
MMREGATDRADRGGNRWLDSSDKTINKPTLAEMGIDGNLAHRARTLDRMTEPEFEAHATECAKNLKTSI